MVSNASVLFNTGKEKYFHFWNFQPFGQNCKNPQRIPPNYKKSLKKFCLVLYRTCCNVKIKHIT